MIRLTVWEGQVFRTQHVTTRDQRHELFNFNLKLKKHKLGRYPPTDSPATPVAARKSVVNASSQSKGDAMSSGTAKDALPVSNQKSSKVSLLDCATTLFQRGYRDAR